MICARCGSSTARAIRPRKNGCWRRKIFRPRAARASFGAHQISRGVGFRAESSFSSAVHRCHSPAREGRTLDERRLSSIVHAWKTPRWRAQTVYLVPECRRQVPLRHTAPVKPPSPGDAMGQKQKKALAKKESGDIKLDKTSKAGYDRNNIAKVINA